MRMRITYWRATRNESADIVRKKGALLEFFRDASSHNVWVALLGED